MWGEWESFFSLAVVGSLAAGVASLSVVVAALLVGVSGRVDGCFACLRGAFRFGRRMERCLVLGIAQGGLQTQRKKATSEDSSRSIFHAAITSRIAIAMHAILEFHWLIRVLPTQNSELHQRIGLL